MAVQIQFRRGTAASWTSSNPTLSLGELGLETDTGQFKVGNGTTAWTSLSYAQMGPSGLQQGSTAPTYTNTLWLDTSATADTMPGYTTLPMPTGGSFFRNHNFTVATGQTPTVNTCYWSPIFIPTTTTFNGIGVSTSTFTSATGTFTARLGIYADSTGVPGALILDAGNTATINASTTSYVVSISQVLTPGWYWLAVAPQATTINCTFLGVAASAVSGLQRMASATSANIYSNFTQASITSTLPATASSATAATTAFPIPYLRTA